VLVRRIVLVCGLVACDAPAARTPAAVGEPSSAVTVSDSLNVELVAPQEVRAGEPVRFLLRVRNAAGRPLDVSLVGRTIVFDIVVTATDGREVWQRLRGETLQPILRVEHLEPGKTLELNEIWDQHSNDGTPASPGAYRVRGIVPTDAEPLRTPEVNFRIVAR
jgi:hypothetical protein